MRTYPRSCWHLPAVVSSAITLSSETQIAKASIQAHPCSFKSSLNEGDPQLTAKHVRVLSSGLPLLLAPPSRFPSADEIISPERIIFSAINESQPSAAITAALSEKKQLLMTRFRFMLSKR